MAEMKIYHDEDVNTDYAKGKVIAIIGYGIQGTAQAKCWRTSGYKVIVGSREDPSAVRAREDGFEVYSIAEAAKKADVICMLIPDMTMKKIYEEQIKPTMGNGKTLYFSHGLNITYKFIVPPKEVDVIMVAPKGPGKKVLETYQEGFGTPALIAIAQNASGRAKEVALELAKGLHATKAGVFESTFDQETYTDLFGEQAVLCGGSVELVKAGFETLVEDGFPPEMAYFEVLHELKLIVDLVQQGGLEFMWDRVSETARYGGRTRGKRIIDASTKQRMKEILKEIKDGTFAREWVDDYNAGMPKFREMKENESKHQIEVVGARIRKLFELETK